MHDVVPTSNSLYIHAHVTAAAACETAANSSSSSSAGGGGMWQQQNAQAQQEQHITAQQRQAVAQLQGEYLRLENVIRYNKLVILTGGMAVCLLHHAG